LGVYPEEILFLCTLYLSDLTVNKIAFQSKADHPRTG